MSSSILFSAYSRFSQIAGSIYELWMITLGVNSKYEDRFGRGDWASIYSTKRNAIWIHAASVGEVRGIIPLLNDLKEEYHLVGSTTSLTGKEEFKKQLESVALLPFDSPSILRRHFQLLKPKLLVINETELWPNLLNVAALNEVPVLLINARISDRSFPRYKLIRGLTGEMLSSVDEILAQTTDDARRLINLGADARRLSVIGSTKYDVQSSMLSAVAKASGRVSLGISESAPCFVAGSVRKGEYEQVVSAYRKARQLVPGLQMIIAPRHPEYFDDVANYISSCELSFRRRSEGADSQGVEVLLLDTIGELSSMYPISDIAFIGGSLIPVGGHNPLEASAAEIPVIFGPYMQNVRELAKELLQSGAAFEVTNSDQLADKLVELLLNDGEYKLATDAASVVCAANRGAVEKVKQMIARYVPVTVSELVKTKVAN